MKDDFSKHIHVAKQTKHTGCMLKKVMHNNWGSQTAEFLRLLFYCVTVKPVYSGHLGTSPKCPDYQGVLIFQVGLHANGYFGTITKCPDYESVPIFKCPD